MDYLSFVTNNSSLPKTNCGNFVVLQEQQQQQQQQQFQSHVSGYNGFHYLVKGGRCDQNGFRPFSSFETNDRVDPRLDRNERKRSLDSRFDSEEIKRKKVSSESESENKGVDGANVEHGLERRHPTRALNIDSRLLRNESGHQSTYGMSNRHFPRCLKGWSDDSMNMDTNGLSNNDCYNGVQQGLGIVSAYNTSSLEHERTVDAVIGYDSLYFYNAMIAEMHGC